MPLVKSPLFGAKAPGRAAALIVASAAVMLAAACSGSGNSADTSGGGNQGGGNNAFAAYTDCLKKNGVTITLPSGGARVRPSGGPDGYGGFPSGQPRPNRSPGAGRPSGGPGGGGFPGGGFGGFGKPAGVDDATWQKAQTACASLRPSFQAGRGGRGDGGGAANAAYRNCLQDHGVTMGGGLNTTDPATQKALAACKVLRPTAIPTPTS